MNEDRHPRELALVRLLIRRDRTPLAAFDRSGCDLDYVARVIDAAFGLLLSRRYSLSTPVRELTLLALGVRQSVGAENSLPVIELEMVLRAALGEPVPLGGLSTDDIATAKVQLLAQLVHHIGMLDSELDSLLDESVVTEAAAS